MSLKDINEIQTRRLYLCQSFAVLFTCLYEISTRHKRDVYIFVRVIAVLFTYLYELSTRYKPILNAGGILLSKNDFKILMRKSGFILTILLCYVLINLTCLVTLLLRT